MSADPDAVFAALADRTRRRLLVTIAERGTATATELAAELPISRQAVAKHLSILDGAGLVERHRSGRETRFEARQEPLRAVTAWVDEVGARWDRRLDRLRHHVTRPRTDPGART